MGPHPSQLEVMAEVLFFLAWDQQASQFEFDPFF
jgi:hypothetical protein